MKKTLILIAILLSMIISCEREWNNPFDTSAHINRSKWTPSKLTVAQTSLGTVELTWNGVDENIEGYKIDRRLNDENWNEELLTFTSDESGTISVLDSTIIPDSDFTYAYRLYAFAGRNESNKISEEVAVEFPPVTDLTLDVVSSSVNQLQWQDNANGEDGYLVERKVGQGNYTDYATLAENSTEYVDSAVAPDQTNYYRISGVYGATKSEGVEISMVSTFEAPSNLVITQQSVSSVQLTWQDNSEGEEGFYIDRKIGDGEWQSKYATVDQKATTFLDESVTPTETCYYNVYAYSGQTETEKVSQSIQVAFNAPENLQVEQVDLNTLTISWQDNNTGEDGFRLFRQQENGSWQLLTTTANTEFTDTSPVYGDNWYKVYAYYQEIKSDSVEVMVDNNISKPTDLSAIVIDNSTVKLNWVNNCPFDHRISVERRPEGGIFESIALLDYDANEYVDDEVDSTQVYDYAVRAYVEPYYSDYSNIICVQTLPPLPFEVVEVPAGNFTYGSSDATETISYDYVIMKYEVTNQQYAEYLQQALEKELIAVSSNEVTGYFGGDYRFTSGNYLYYDLGDENARIYYSNDQFYAESGYSNHPVTQVTWFGANGFADFYRAKLPSEFEWEKAARGNTGNKYPWGDDYDSHYCNHQGSGYPETDGTTPIGFYDGMTHDGYSTLDNSSYYGAYDMAGNVAEFTGSYAPEDSDKHIIRGGSWYFSEDHIFTYSSLSHNSEKGYSYVGFRIMRKQ